MSMSVRPISTDMIIGTTALSLTIAEFAREVRKLGLSEANKALVALALARFLKALLAVLKATKQALSVYKRYLVCRAHMSVITFLEGLRYR